MVSAVAKPLKIAKDEAKRKRGSKPQTINVNGRNYAYENEAVPAGIPVYRAVCEVCKKASSYLMLHKPPTVECMSCKEDRIAEFILNVQEESGENFGYRPVEPEKRHKTLSPSDAFGMHVVRKR